MPLRIEGLAWDDENEAHVERHIATWEIEELLEGGDYAEFRNTKDLSLKRWKIIGRTPGGVFVTLILEEPGDGDPTRWRPITAWRSSDVERKKYGEVMQRTRRKRGRKHG